MSDTQFFTHESLKLAYTVTGEGPPLLLVHGWPFHKANFRKIIPLLAPHYTCYAIDLAGMGESEWTPDTDLGFYAHVKRIKALVDHLGLTSYAVVGHDTGGTVARILAVEDALRVTSVTAIDTEIPHKFPPTVTLLQRLHRNWLTRPILKRLLASEKFTRSSSGYGSFFHDAQMFTPEFMDLFVHYWQRSPKAYGGLMSYLTAVDPAIVDTLDDIHAQTNVPMHFIWGRGDKIFPVKFARDMVERIPGEATLDIVDGARFVPQEEKPDEVASLILGHLASSRKVA